LKRNLKIINGNLYFFRSIADSKAETLYNLYESKIELIGPETDLNSENFKMPKNNSNSSICNLESIEEFLNKTILSMNNSDSK